MSAILEIPVTKIRTGRNPRKTFNEETLKELAGSRSLWSLTAKVISW